MGIYSEYLDALKGFEAYTAERKKQLRRISELRKSDVLVIAAAIEKASASIDNSDLIPIADQLDGLTGGTLDVILETPGGSGEVTEEIVKLLRRRHTVVNFIVPGTAKSAGTIMVMSGDEIMMGSLSALGPIDAQVARNGKYFSAEAFLEGLEKIKQESDEKKHLNRAYIPILQGISPGEIEAARNALKFGMSLAARWLETHKFRHWTVHESTGAAVTVEERKQRAEKIASALGSHAKWLSHGRSIKSEDLLAMGIRITNYEQNPDLNDAIRRYHTLLRMSFEGNMVKLFETAKSQIYRFSHAPAVTPGIAQAKNLLIDFACSKCRTVTKLQANFGVGQLIKAPVLPFPKNNKFSCPACGTEADLTGLRLQIEAQTKKAIL
ncbi:MAG: Clp protease ClpP [Dechloromonas sp.]|nr:MAG: Clp protease ClpP [Dechloromonas sp.]